MASKPMREALDRQYVVPPVPQPVLPVDGTAAWFPVNRIFCVGRNYADHAREMGHDPTREPPFFFMKPGMSVLIEEEFPYPPRTNNLHHEIELVVALGNGGADIPEGKALETIYGYAVGLDMTRRDLQAEAKKLGRPWDIGKGFEHSAPCSKIAPAAKIGHIERGEIRLEVNGEIRQRGDVADLIWSIPEMIAHLSTLFTLAAGDLIFTGTPAGVGPVNKGDVMVGSVDGVGSLSVRIV